MAKRAPAMKKPPMPDFLGKGKKSAAAEPGKKVAVKVAKPKRKRGGMSDEAMLKGRMV